MMKGEFAVVDYVGYESTYSDILALDNVRHSNTKYAMSATVLWCYFLSSSWFVNNTWNVNLGPIGHFL